MIALSAGEVIFYVCFYGVLGTVAFVAARAGWRAGRRRRANRGAELAAIREAGKRARGES